MMTEDPGDALWTWSLSVYAQNDVKAALLGAQNQFGAHVPLLLWGAHAAIKGSGVSLDDARAAKAALSSLSLHTRALRDARRQLPMLAAKLPAGARDAAIAHIAEAEIALEQLELAKLAEQRVRSGAASPRETLSGNLSAALQAAGLDLSQREAKAALDSLVNAFAAHFTA